MSEIPAVLDFLFSNCELLDYITSGTTGRMKTTEDYKQINLEILGIMRQVGRRFTTLTFSEPRWFSILRTHWPGYTAQLCGLGEDLQGKPRHLAKKCCLGDDFHGELEYIVREIVIYDVCPDWRDREEVDCMRKRSAQLKETISQFSAAIFISAPEGVTWEKTVLMKMCRARICDSKYCNQWLRQSDRHYSRCEDCYDQFFGWSEPFDDFE